MSTTSGMLVGERFDGLLAGSGAFDRPALVLERQLDRLADALVVLDGQDSCSHGDHDARIRGPASGRIVARHVGARAARARARRSVVEDGRARRRAAEPGRPARRRSRRLRQPASRAISSPAAASQAFSPAS